MGRKLLGMFGGLAVGALIALPHPTWFIGLDLACYVPLAWLGGRLVAAPGAASGADSVGA